MTGKADTKVIRLAMIREVNRECILMSGVALGKLLESEDCGKHCRSWEFRSSGLNEPVRRRTICGANDVFRT